MRFDRSDRSYWIAASLFRMDKFVSHFCVYGFGFFRRRRRGRTLIVGDGYRLTDEFLFCINASMFSCPPSPWPPLNNAAKASAL